MFKAPFYRAVALFILYFCVENYLAKSLVLTSIKKFFVYEINPLTFM